MKKILLLLLIVAGFCYYYNPPFEDHIKAIVSEAPQGFVSSGKIDEKIQENLDFINLVVASATKDKQIINGSHGSLKADHNCSQTSWAYSPTNL
jgi:hypothetical protein